MILQLKSKLKIILEDALTKAYPQHQEVFSLDIECPADTQFGELSTNVALRSAKVFKKSPLQIAQEFQKLFEEALRASPFGKIITQVDIKGPGFINFHLSLEGLSAILADILEQKSRYGQSSFGQNKRMQIEFVSANPTGPLSIAHARQAAVGDALGNILKFLGFDVTKEFYVNDEGNQINLLGDSLRLRIKEALSPGLDLTSQFSADHYVGDYIKDIAQDYIQKNRIKNAADLKESLVEYSSFIVNVIMGIIHKDLEDFGVKFDQWTYQSKVASPEAIDKTIEFLKEKQYVYEKEGALWFRTTQWGDDKDRVLLKSDKSYTYLAPDIVYHHDKYKRGFQKIINIWGPDHHGYIPRIKASVAALGYDMDSLTVLIVQLATIYKNGQPMAMSTRRGQYISLRQVIDEVGVDAARFFFLMRHIKQHLDFDLDLAKKESPENPVYYIQYAHARIHSIQKKAMEEKVTAQYKKFERLKEREELDLIREMAQFPEVLMYCQEQLDPYPLVSYLQSLATRFHKFYDQHKVLDADPVLAQERLGLTQAVVIVLANGLSLLGLATPEKM